MKLWDSDIFKNEPKQFSLNIKSASARYALNMPFDCDVGHLWQV